MAKFKPLNENQLVMLPISLQDQLVPGTLEHTISVLVDKHLDLSVFDARYNNDLTGAPAIHPKILLKVILLAYARGMISSRQIERACQENILFIALSYGYAPDHSTIASFISSMQDEVQTLFSDALLVCEDLGLLDGTHFSLDGVKLSANVSKEWSGTIKELEHKRDKLQEKLKRVIAEHAQADKQPDVVVERQKKRERRFQLQVQRLNHFLKDRKPKLGSEGKEIQSNAVDNQSVKMPSAHGVIQGYNAQALVDCKHQVILAAEAFASQDHDNLKPMLDGAKKNLVTIGKEPAFFEGKQLTADPNYHSLNSLKVCQDEKLDAYIPDIHYRSRDPRFPAPNAGRCSDQERFTKENATSKPKLFTAADFTFDATRQVYLCPNGKELTCHARNHANRHRTYDLYHARPEDCAVCPLRSRCLKKADTLRRNLSIQVESQSPNLIDEMKAKIDSDQGKRIYSRRLGIVEPVFSNICVQKRMHRFTLRSKLKVDVQWRLFALVHNIGKIHKFGGLI